MKSLFSIIFLFAAFCLANGQQLADTVQIQRSFSPVFRQHGERLKARDLLEITRSNPEAYKEMRIAKSNYDASQVFGYAGGFLIGWPLGTALAGGDPNWGLAVAGGGLVLLSLPFSSGFSKHAMKAMHIYNSDLRQIARNQVQMKVGVSPTGIKLQLKL